MTPTTRILRRYDHRLRDLVRSTSDIGQAERRGVPRSTARGWLTSTRTEVVTIDVFEMDVHDLQQEVLALRKRVERVVVRFHDPAEGKKADSETTRQLAKYMEDAISKAISGRYAMVSQPGPGVARLRVALTDLDKGKPALNVLPQTKLTGLGLGGAAMEAELLDSQTGAQIAAVIQKKKGSMVSFSGLKEWGDAKAVMDA